MKVILFTLHLLDPDVMSFRHDPLVAIGIFYLEIKSQMLNRCRAVKWFAVIQHPIGEFDKYTVKEYILIISQHKSNNLMALVLFNVRVELLSKAMNSKLFWRESERG